MPILQREKNNCCSGICIRKQGSASKIKVRGQIRKKKTCLCSNYHENRLTSLNKFRIEPRIAIMDKQSIFYSRIQCHELARNL